MINVPTHDVTACLAQIERLADVGADLVRLAVPTAADTAALKQIVPASPLPLIADVHFHFDRALEAIAAGVAKVRLNPGNISDRAKVEQVMHACRDHGTAIRVGVNSGSIRSRIGSEKTADAHRSLPDLMVEKISAYLDIFAACDFDQIVLSAKCSDVPDTIAVYRTLAQRFDFPLHLGFTAAGPLEIGLIKNSLALGPLLAEGLGDTLRISLTADPVQEVLAGKEILYNLGLHKRTEPELISCPTCGRCHVNLLEVVHQARLRLSHLHTPIRIAIMGCEVNGPGEAADADYALCMGPKKALLYCHGQLLGSYSFESMLDELLRIIDQPSA
jgi:(E)-4-hydroxy-3-methylbut-2-enyl-diphosphate synthase